MPIDMTKDCVKIVSDGKFLIATMPNGDVIPMQVGLVLQNDVDDRGFAHCTVTLKCAISLDDFEIVKHIKNG